MTHLQCLRCEHYRFSKKCAAYPKKIPDEILSGRIDHTEPYTDDNGITFKEVSLKPDEIKSDPRFVKSTFTTKTVDEKGLRQETVYNFKTGKIMSKIEIELPEQFRAKPQGRAKK